MHWFTVTCLWFLRWQWPFCRITLGPARSVATKQHMLLAPPPPHPPPQFLTQHVFKPAAVTMPHKVQRQNRALPQANASHRSYVAIAAPSCTYNACCSIMHSRPSNNMHKTNIESRTGADVGSHVLVTVCVQPLSVDRWRDIHTHTMQINTSKGAGCGGPLQPQLRTTVLYRSKPYGNATVE